MIQEWLEYFKYPTPFATFFIGVWATPFIEVRKEKAKAKSVQKNLISEIKDELSELPDKLSKIANTLNSLRNLKTGKPESGGSFKYAPRNTSLHFLKPATESSFFIFNKDQRFAIKSLFVRINAIDDYLLAIKSTKLSDTTLDEAINNRKRYLYTGTCMLNTMRLIANNPQADTSGEDENIINAIFL